MAKIEVITTRPVEGGAHPFEQDALTIVFRSYEPDFHPLMEGPVWAFVDWRGAELPGGFVCRSIRQSSELAKARIVAILDDCDPDTIRRALRAGADDFMIGRPDRYAIVDRILEQSQDEELLAVENITVGDLVINPAGYRAFWKDKPFILSLTEFRLLLFFAEHPNRVFSRAELIVALGRSEERMDLRTVDVWIGRLRNSLRDAGAGNLLRTVRMVGYVLDGDVKH